MKNTLLIFLFLFSAFFAEAQQRYTLSGIIRDESTRELLTGVNIWVRETASGTSSDFEGRFSLQLPAGEYTLVFSFIGYQNLEKKVRLTSDERLQVMMKNGGIRLSEVVVEAERSNRNVERAEMSTVILSMESIRNIPAFLGEVDVLRTIQLLPGVQSAGDGNTGFFVRGGNADQNLVMLDDAVVFNASHLFNFFSVFNPDAIKDITLYKGGILPAYGGRLSSVLDVRTKDGDLNQYRMSGGLGLISSRLTVEGPIEHGRSAFLVSGRRTYADLFLRLSSDETQRETQLFFYDLNARANYVFNNRNRIFVSGYYGRDVTVFSDLFSFDWGNATTSLRWNHIYNTRLFSDFSLLYSNYQFNISGDVGPARFRWNSNLHNLQLKADFNYILNDNNTLTFGAQTIRHNLDPGLIEASIEGAASARFDLTQQNAYEHGIYVNDEQNLFHDRLLLSYGMRLSIFQIIGPGRQYSYDRSDPLRWNVTDTLVLQRGKFYNNWAHAEPRLSFRFRLGEKSSVKGSFNRMVQYIQQAQSAQSVAPYDVWYAASNNIPPQIADQTALGYFRNFLDNRIETSVEVYYKDLKNVSDVVDNGDILGNEFLEGQLRIGRGWAYGAEFLVQKPSGRLNGFVGYTWAVARRQIDGINQGNAYYAPNDRRHDLSLSGSYDITRRWNVGLTFIYATGSARTLPVGKIFYQGAFAPVYSDRNSGRLPDYHRMDLSVTYTPQIRNRDGRRFESSWNFSIFNLYGRVNPISISFAEKAERPGVPNSSFFYIPGPIPAITWNFNF